MKPDLNGQNKLDNKEIIPSNSKLLAVVSNKKRRKTPHQKE